MGRRHLFGLAELQRVAPSMVRLATVTDREPGRATALADEVERLLGHRPCVVDDLAALVRDGVAEAIDVTTSTASHVELGLEAFDLRLHVLMEKPLAVSIRGDVAD
jgi:predicted dehydrogenase